MFIDNMLINWVKLSCDVTFKPNHLLLHAGAFKETPQGRWIKGYEINIRQSHAPNDDMWDMWHEIEISLK